MSLSTETFLSMLHGAEPDGFRELRALGELDSVERFYPTTEPTTRLLEAAQELQSEYDVYIGVAPRATQAGGKDAVTRSHVLCGRRR